MMVTFVSQCEKKALNKTRRVLDAFANRIGNRTWQTVITNEGLRAVKKLLRKTATKNTAVSCHWIRSRSRSEYLWAIGNKNKFNSEGIVPVNFTQQDISQFKDSARWKTIEVIKYASAIAGLFHDFGKANVLFQNKINKDYKPKKGEKKRNYEPYRHEWVSFRIFQGFAEGKDDSEWLDELSEIGKDSFNHYYKDGLPSSSKGESISINELQPLAQLIAWLILTHHRLPLSPAWLDDYSSIPLDRVDKWRNDDFNAVWNSYKSNEIELKELQEDNWTLQSLPSESYRWRSETSNLVAEAISSLKIWIKKECNENYNWLDEQLFTTHLSRLCLMMADHFYSAQEEVTSKWRGKDYNVYANTYRDKYHPKYKEHKQQLDEHLIGVAHNAKGIAKALSKLNTTLPSLDSDKSELQDKVTKEFKDKFGWQDRVKKIASDVSKSTIEQGFFGINMASTGKGKTLANAKIMYALGDAIGRRRFNVAIGLRSLTLQTGKEFQSKLKLTDDDLAIAVGGSSVKQLFEYQQRRASDIKQAENTDNSGSASADEIIDPDLYVHYKGKYTDHSLSEWTKSKYKEKLSKLDNLLQAPVLVSTIDHLMPACEGTKGGKQIAPMLRLLSSDLVLDEPDDFGLEDLPALCRLVHWSAMLGSRVLLSTATMPPYLAYALFQAYQAGWSHYAKANIDNWNGKIVCAWFDEFDKPDSHIVSNTISAFESFKTSHDKFVKQRVALLEKNSAVQRKGKIITVDCLEYETVVQSMARVIQKNLIELHGYHNQSNKKKTISIGLVRMANINPLVAISKSLLQLNIKVKDTCIHYCVYHSRYPLAVRSYLEGELDNILNRKDEKTIWGSDKGVGDILENYPEKHHIFVVLASPVAEVGRDHDYDWAIVEPSSMRSIIQIAGRVLRHRNDVPKHENVLILNKNYKALKNKKNRICFERPGFESEKIRISDNDLNNCLEKEQYQQINAIQRITVPESLNKNNAGNNLVGLEHYALKDKLFSKKRGAKMWWKNSPHWCGEMQRQQRFRSSPKDEAFYPYLEHENDQHEWKWKNENVFPPELDGNPSGAGVSIKSEQLINFEGSNYFWFDLNISNIYKALVDDSMVSADDYKNVSQQFGEVRLIAYNENKEEAYLYHENLGLYKELGEII